MKLKDRIVLHCDANNFFASVETINKPELRDKPVAVSGNPKKRTGIILAKNELAKKFGVKTGEPIFQALQKCPDLVCLPPHHSLYEQYSEKLREIYSTYTDKIESFGIDECWLDVTGSLRLFKSGWEIAEQIRERVKSELGLTVSIGISFCKVFAKLASDMKKPDAITEISRENFKKIVYPLTVSTIVGIGRKMGAQLNKINVFTLGDYVSLPSKLIEQKFGKVGISLKEKLEGFDLEEVVSNEPPPKSVGNSTTTIIDITSKEDIQNTIAFLCDKISKRLRQQGFLAYGISVGLKTSDFKKMQAEKRISSPTNSGLVLANHANEILESNWAFETSVRAVGVKCFALVRQNELVQASIFYDKKKESLGYGLDTLRTKYGKDILSLGSSLKSANFLNDRKEN